ncbi:MAG: cob(I)yrinic acid a,c-diamide adenosyltransferase [Lachnospiraceae bacterium]|nr:cob(I)yrinic acid a,c-diamide adenosyltransferase [Lachnospiraceae bacterium]
MSMGKIQVYFGNGRGKTSAVLGSAIHEASGAGSVIIIEFLKRKNEDEITFLKRLEPEIRVFRFQKTDRNYEELDAQGQFDEQMNMKNGMNFARKVLQTGECSKLILDEVLGLVDYGIISEDELLSMLRLRSEETDIILTGRVLGDTLREYADAAYEISVRKDVCE